MKKLVKKMGIILCMSITVLCFSSMNIYAAEKDNCKHEDSYKIVLLPEDYELTEAYVIHCDECDKNVEFVLPKPKQPQLVQNIMIAQENVVLLQPTEDTEGIECDINVNGAKINIRKIEKVKTLKFTELKKETKVFLAPSAQDKNMYNNGVNSEEEIMNDIMDLVEANLQECEKLTIVRNDPEKFVTEYIKDSNKANVDLHFSLHSNATESHNSRGPLVIANPNKPESLKWANIMYDNLISIYPEPSEGKGILKNSSYYEMRKVNATSIIIELAFHDQKDDQNWILKNKQKIADNLTESLIQYMNTLK